MVVIPEMKTGNYETESWVYKCRTVRCAISLDLSYDNSKTIMILSLDNSKNISFSPVLIPR
jgi:hypothetical protein